MNFARPVPSSRFSGYRLLDFGDGRKLEELAGYRIERPSPAAEGIARKAPASWRKVDAIYQLERHSWSFRKSWPRSMQLDCDGFLMPVQPTPYGHIGLFPEQASNWSWIRQQIADWTLAGSIRLSDAQAKHVDVTPDAQPPVDDEKLTHEWGLNLFGYTGASTMAMVSAGLAVSHVDAAKPNVQACKIAAEINGWGNANIRYLVDDALKFAKREVRRNRQYRMIVLDPPAYGHAPSGKAWRLERDLWPLLDACVGLLSVESFALLVTGHSPQVGAEDVVNYLMSSTEFKKKADGSLGAKKRSIKIDSGRSYLESRSGGRMDTGFYARFWS